MFGIIYFLLYFSLINGLFVRIGDYPEYRQYGINEDRCGRGALPLLVNWTVNEHCLLNSYPDMLYVFRYGNTGVYTGAEVSTRIWNGRNARVGESPWTVKLIITLQIRHADSGLVLFERPKTCTGVLITFEWMLTAAHCMAGDSAVEKVFDVKVWAGISAEWGNSVDMRYVFKHPEWRLEIKDTEEGSIVDIAVVKLNSKFDQDRFDDHFYHINTVCLPNESPLNTKVELATSVGWGRIDESGTPPKKLQLYQTGLFPSNKCPQGKILCHQVFGANPKTCSGDSGGPLIQYSDEQIPRAIVIGIAKGGGGRCAHGHAGRSWSAPMRYIPWILKTIKVNTNL